jgi:outer membrane immunogenic protein
MKRAITLGIGALALAGLTLPTSAADLGARPITKAPAVAPPIAFSWTSCYIGGNAGGKWGRFSGDATITTPILSESLLFPGGIFGVNNNHDFDGSFVGGGQIGCQWQAGSFVFGIEGDFDATDVRQTFVAPPGVILFAPGDSVDFRNRWQASVRGRLGYAWDRWLVYATGGVAFADVRATVNLVPPGFTAITAEEDTQTLTGGTVGAGVDYAITDNLSLGVEYRFSKFGHETFTFPALITAPSTLTATTDLETHEVTARLNWHFNWLGRP